MILINKKDIRIKIKKRKSNVFLTQIENDSNLIINSLMSTKEYLNSNQVFSYVSYNKEVVTKTFIEQSFKGKKIAVPKIIGEEMFFYYINSLDELEEGVQGILEPAACPENEAIPEADDLFVVPGLAFDRNKNRIGYGKGYYDKYFQKYNNIHFQKIALAFDFQILEQIPVNDYDIKVDGIITPGQNIF